MNTHELGRRLLAMPDMPVVMAQDNEPLGDYGVAAADVRLMRRDNFWPHRQTWEPASAHRPEPQHDVEVCYLDCDEPPAEVVDAEVVQECDQITVPCPQCGNELRVGVAILPGDSVVCPRCHQVSRLSADQLEIGAGWRELVAKHKAGIEGYDRDTRTLATAEQARAALDGCVGCGKPDKIAGREICAACLDVLEGRRA